MAKSYITYTHTSPEINTLDDFISNPLSLVPGMTVQELLNYSGGGLVLNLDRIYETYSLEDQEKFKDAYASASLTQLDAGTRLLLPKEKLNKEPLLSEGNSVVESISAAAFVAEKLRDLEEDPDFTQLFTSIDENNGVVKEMYPNVTVWIWCRSLSPEFDDQQAPLKELPGTIIDVSQFVINLSTSTAGDAGNFQLSLPAITCEKDEKLGWRIRRDLISNHDTLSGRDYTFEDILNRNGGRSNFYFHNILGENDVVFIRYEVLKNETLRRNNPNNFVVDKSQIPNQTYDMIGLIDKAPLSVNPDTNDVSINVSGRDFMKLLIDDGCYVYPGGYGTNNFVENQDNTKLIQRLVSNGGLNLLSAFVKRPIDFSVLFIINQLSSIGVVPNDLFSFYAERRSTTYLLEEAGNPQSTTETLMEGVWQICKFVFDESIASRRVVDSSISFAQGSLINYIRKVCQDPWVEFYGDTYGDEYVFIARQKPFTKDSFISLIPPTPSDEDVYSYGNIRDEDIVNEDLDFDSEVYSWYRVLLEASLSGAGDDSIKKYSPAVYFDRYADIWGSKPFDQVSNYLDYTPRSGDKEMVKLGYYDQQLVHDLKYIIDSHAYLPFTRTGTITINGDRRFKKGTVVRHLGTGEVFYVDSVTHNYSISDNSIERLTTLQVSRGMVEKYVYGGKAKDGIPESSGRNSNGSDGIPSNPAPSTSSDSTTAANSLSQDAPNSNNSTGGSIPLPTYWDIIDTSIEKAFQQVNQDSSLDIRAVGVKIAQNWKVNDRVFNFFLRRQQFDG